MCEAIREKKEWWVKSCRYGKQTIDSSVLWVFIIKRYCACNVQVACTSIGSKGMRRAI